jgi:lysophospholipase L1-like esterase
MLSLAASSLTASRALKWGFENIQEVNILCIGDSITAGMDRGQQTPGYQNPLLQILNGKNIMATMVTEAMPGAKTSYWVDRIFINRLNRPDLILFATGTNERPFDEGIAAFVTAYRACIKKMKPWSFNNPKVIGAHIQYSIEDGTGVVDREIEVNKALANLQHLCDGFADFRTIPSTPEYLPDKIHPSYPLGYTTMAEKWYDVIAPVMDWPVR